MTAKTPLTTPSSIRAISAMLRQRLATATRMPLILLVAMSQAQAQGIDPPSVQRWVEPSELAATARKAGQTADAATLGRLQQAAEAAFAAQQFHDAQLGFARLVELDDRQALAWFRLGNLYQRASDLTAATEAYRRVIQLIGPAADDDGLREKSLMNLALLGLWRTRLALAELERMTTRADLHKERQSIDGEMNQAESRLRALTRSRGAEASLAPGAVPSTRIATMPVAVAPAAGSAPARTFERPVGDDGDSNGARRFGPPPRVEHFQGMPPLRADSVKSNSLAGASSERHDRYGRTEGHDRSDQTERGERADRGERTDRGERIDRSERGGQSEPRFATPAVDATGRLPR